MSVGSLPHARGECTPCGCLNGGACQADGSCLCDFPLAGDRCEGGMDLMTFNLIVTLVPLLVVVFGALILAFACRKRLARFIARASPRTSLRALHRAGGECAGAGRRRGSTNRRRAPHPIRRRRARARFSKRRPVFDIFSSCRC